MAILLVYNSVHYIVSALCNNLIALCTAVGGGKVKSIWYQLRLLEKAQWSQTNEIQVSQHTAQNSNGFQLNYKALFGFTSGFLLCQKQPHPLPEELARFLCIKTRA